MCIFQSCALCNLDFSPLINLTFQSLSEERVPNKYKHLEVGGMHIYIYMYIL